MCDNPKCSENIWIKKLISLAVAFISSEATTEQKKMPKFSFGKNRRRWSPDIQIMLLYWRTVQQSWMVLGQDWRKDFWFFPPELRANRDCATVCSLYLIMPTRRVNRNETWFLTPTSGFDVRRSSKGRRRVEKNRNWVHTCTASN